MGFAAPDFCAPGTSASHDQVPIPAVSVQALSGLQQLNLAGIELRPGATAPLVPVLQSLTGLLGLSLQDTPLGPIGLVSLAHAVRGLQLHTLDLSYCALGGNALRRWRQLSVP